ncbi:hypothetical protein IW140_004375 [Coemansia sp. RSA 1813]|nr:hypothetical protein EV178_004445 [Coemansia sp. RSA 1646]KAJ1768367.1 hypothetical protein LPJ74_004895 [Coemansia sp. RSA 1843]KAJ2087902.1 hypothetical protein IW138_004600 [Coemansia sp. RSA 986]KAJ2212902.1 hypothetical protein EV179_004303 [Coemansia sp. RSA 487]KAJ2567672.1 hypothetical protein IW140_004375 [Coemansia sp. RSA 1813]
MALETLVTELTTSGLESLDTDKLSELKQMCRDDRSGATIVEAFAQLFKALHKGHSQVRVSALQAMNELFKRSHQFRLLVIEELPQFITLTMGAYQKKLPPPSTHAKRLKALTAEYLYAWVERFGFAYQRLVYALRYLRFTEHVDFRAAAKAYRMKDPERIKRRHETFVANRREYMRRTLVAVLADFLDKRRGMEMTLVCLNSCFEALVPDLAEMFGIESKPVEQNLDEPQIGRNETDNNDDDLDEIMAVMAANRHAIHIEFDPEKVLDVEETEENAAIYDVVRDHLKVCLQIHQPLVYTWMARLDQIDNDIDIGVSELKANVRHLNSRLSGIVSKCKDLGVDFSYMEPKEHEESSDDEFEDVPFTDIRQKNGRKDQKANAVQNKRKRNSVFALLGESGLASDPTVVDPKILRHRPAKLHPRKGIASNNNSDNSGSEQKPESSNPIEDKLRETAPVVSYDTDLMYWNSGDISANTSGLEIRHRFLGSAHEEPIVSEAAARRMRMRTVYFKDLHSHTGSAKTDSDKREIKACRAPLKSGKLCPRRDLVKCPFHGVVIPRDEFGRPQGQTGDTAAEEQQPQGSEHNNIERGNETPGPNSVATAENMDDLRAEDIEKLVADKYQPTQAGRGKRQKQEHGGAGSAKGTGSSNKSSLVNIHKKKPAGIKHLQKLVKKYYK